MVRFPAVGTETHQTHQAHHFRRRYSKTEVDAMNSPERPHPIDDTEKPRKVLIAAAVGAFVGRLAGDGATDARREWLPKLWDWLKQ